MLIRNATPGMRRWCRLVIVLTALVMLSSCVSSTLNTTGSTALTDNEAYDEIKTIAEKLSNSGDPIASDMLIEKSRTFIKVYPKDKRVDEVYYLLGRNLMQLDRN